MSVHKAWPLDKTDEKSNVKCQDGAVQWQFVNNVAVKRSGIIFVMYSSFCHEQTIELEFVILYLTKIFIMLISITWIICALQYTWYP